MAANDAAAALAAPASRDDARGVSPYELSVWGVFFASYYNPISKESQNRMRERAHELQGEVRRMFEAKSGADLAALVDTIEHLGIQNGFREEIGAAMSRVCNEELEFSSSDDLHAVARRFRLLRQHGIWVSADVFDKFRDGKSFSMSLCNKPRALLSLYNAAHMAIPGEKKLDDAITFTKGHLDAMKDDLQSPLTEQVSRALDIPLPRISRWIESMHYIAEYEQEEAHDATLFELAKLVFELARCRHLEELRELTLWWRELYNDVRLPYARDCIVETFFWACEVIPEEENARSRIMFTKTFAYISLIDDTFDVHATLEESRMFNEAIQRWDESAVSVVPEYLRTLYLRTFKGLQEFEDMLEPKEKYRMPYVIRAFKLLLQYYLEEAIWVSQNYEPNFHEHARMSAISCGLPMLVTVVMLGLSGDPAPTKMEFEWVNRMPDMVMASGQLGPFLNDIAVYRLGKKKDVANWNECYMKQFRVTGEEAFAAIAGMAEHAWRSVNKGCLLEVNDPAATRTKLSAVQVTILDMTRSLEIIYLGGKRDAYTFRTTLKDLVTSLFIKPIFSV